MKKRLLSFIFTVHTLLLFAQDNSIKTLQINEYDFAIIGDDNIIGNGTFLSPGSGWMVSGFKIGNGLTSAIGVPNIASTNVDVVLHQTYLFKMSVNCTSSGFIDIRLGGKTILDDKIEGIFVSKGLHAFDIGMHAYVSGSQILSIVSDAHFAGSITSISMIKVKQETHAAFSINSADNKIKNSIPYQIKVGRYNAGQIGMGDRLTQSLQGSDAVWNVAVGARALAYNQKGIENIAIGTFALQYNQQSRLTALGYGALKYNINGINNTGLGYKANAQNVNGNNNTAVGFWSLLQNQSDNNTALGFQTLYNTKHGAYNTAIGSQAGLNNDGSGNTYIGALSGYLNSDGNAVYSYNFNTNIGAETKTYGSNNTTVGYQSTIGNDLSNTAGSSKKSVAIGSFAKINGDNSVVVGANANTNNDNCIVMGSNASATNNESVAIGSASIAGGIRSVAIGNESASNFAQSTVIGFRSRSGGASGVAIGAQAGNNIEGSNNTFIGAYAGNLAKPQKFQNVTCIGFNAQATSSNQVVLGDTSTTVIASGLEVVDEHKGIILRSPNGNRWQITVDNNGTLKATAVKSGK